MGSQVLKVFQVLTVPSVPQVKLVPKAEVVTMDKTVQLVPEVSEVCQVPLVPEVVWEVMPVRKNLSGKKFELSLTNFCTRKRLVEALGTNTSASVKLFIFMMLSSLV